MNFETVLSIYDWFLFRNIILALLKILMDTFSVDISDYEINEKIDIFLFNKSV